VKHQTSTSEFTIIFQLFLVLASGPPTEPGRWAPSAKFAPVSKL